MKELCWFLGGNAPPSVCGSLNDMDFNFDINP